jgi:hypothetical protein
VPIVQVDIRDVPTDVLMERVILTERVEQHSIIRVMTVHSVMTVMERVMDIVLAGLRVMADVFHVNVAMTPVRRADIRVVIQLVTLHVRLVSVVIHAMEIVITPVMVVIRAMEIVILNVTQGVLCITEQAVQEPAMYV